MRRDDMDVCISKDEARKMSGHCTTKPIVRISTRVLRGGTLLNIGIQGVPPTGTLVSFFVIKTANSIARKCVYPAYILRYELDVCGKPDSDQSRCKFPQTRTRESSARSSSGVACRTSNGVKEMAAIVVPHFDRMTTTRTT